MSLLDRMRKLAKEKEANKPPEIESASPAYSIDNWNIYEAIKMGADLGKGLYLVGASDAELQIMFPHLNSNTVRYIRWTFEKNGYVEESGKTRNIKAGGRKHKVWVATDKVVEHPNEVKPEEKVILLDSSGKRV